MGDTRGAQCSRCSAQASYQSCGNAMLRAKSTWPCTSANIWGVPDSAGATGAASQAPASKTKKEKKKKKGGLWLWGMCTARARWVSLLLTTWTCRVDIKVCTVLIISPWLPVLNHILWLSKKTSAQLLYQCPLFSYMYLFILRSTLLSLHLSQSTELQKCS